MVRQGYDKSLIGIRVWDALGSQVGYVRTITGCLEHGEIGCDTMTVEWLDGERSEVCVLNTIATPYNTPHSKYSRTDRKISHLIESRK